MIEAVVAIIIFMFFSYLKVIDKYNEYLVSAYITASGDRFLILHDVKNEEAIRVFFLEAYELYLKCLLNPFYEKGQVIDSKLFDTKIKMLAKKHLDK